MFGGKTIATAPLLVPLLLVGVAAQGASMPRGRVLGPATTMSAQSHSIGPLGTRVTAAPMANASACTVYFDATGQLNFNPPAANTALTPGISAANFIGGGPALAHGSKAANALAGATTLSADAGIDGASLLPPYASIAQNRIPGIAYFATDTTCTQSSFTTVLQSSPAGTGGPGGTVMAQLNANTTIAASYSPAYADQGRYICTDYFYQYYCEVWRVDVAFSFLTNSFLANGAGSYTLTINQVTLSSP